MGPQFDLRACASEIATSRNLEDLWGAMVRHFMAPGFAGVCYIVFSRGHPGEIAMMLVDGFPVTITRAFKTTLGQGRNDPNFRHALATGQPSLRSRIAEVTDLSPDEQRFVGALSKLNHSNTLALPVFGPQNYVGIVALGLAEDEGLFERVDWTQLHMAALAAHLRGRVLQPSAPIPKHNLSPREVEILVWVAQGKSNSVIAEILSIAATTVDTYLRRIFLKLGVADRTSAAVKAVSLGVIRI